MDEEMQCTSPELTEITNSPFQYFIPEKSRKVYEFAYERFLKWAEENNARSYTERVMLAYFTQLSKKLKSSSVWAQYSMIKAVLNIKHNINIDKYSKVLAFLKRHGEGYEPKKSRALSKQQFDNFLRNAPNKTYLAAKVILIFGVIGACRCDELLQMNVSDIKDLGDSVLVKIPKSKTKKSRSFIITGDFHLNVYREYASLRPKDITFSRFFIKYQNGRCHRIVMGIHKISHVPREVASYLKLTNPNEYTGHCLRRTSATFDADSDGGDVVAHKRHGRWKSESVAQDDPNIPAEGEQCDTFTNNENTNKVMNVESGTGRTETVKQEQLDFNQMCRTCKNESPEMQSLFTCHSEIGPRIDEMLMTCASVKVSCEDELPKSMCRTCVQQLANAFSFKRLCESTDASLRQYVKNSQVKIEETIIQNLDSSGKHVKNLNENCHVKIEEVKIEEPNNEQSSFSSLFMKELVVKDEIKSLPSSATLLTCGVCLGVFTTSDGLQCHKCVGLFKCKQCGKEYTRLDHLEEHELSHSSGKEFVCKEEPYRCQTCNQDFNDAYYLENHMNQCSGEKIHMCDVCNAGFKEENVLEVHKTNAHGDQKLISTIMDNLHSESDIGNTTFSRPCDLEDPDSAKPEVDIVDPENDTMLAIYAEENPPEIKFFVEDKEAHVEITSADDSDSAYSEYSPTKPSSKTKRGRGRPQKYPLPGKSRPRGRPALLKIKSQPKSKGLGEYPCPECDLVFPKMTMLERHAQIHDGLKLFSCGTCGKKFTRSFYLKRHMSNHSEVKPFVCNVCSKRYARRDNLESHKKVHSRTKDYECTICKHSFYHVEVLEKHVAIRHSKEIISEKKFKCPVCTRGFTTAKYRDFHLKVHTSDRKFRCKICNKAYFTKSHLTQHTKLHDETLKKFLCSECGMRFFRNDYLIIHMRRHRGEKPFKCKYCGKGFPRSADAACHELRHTGEKKHVCTICGKRFARYYSLSVHMRTHTGEKPYQCTYCTAAFAQSNDLRTHIRRHTGERFQCDLCPRDFYVGYELERHKRVVHGGNVARLEPVKLSENNSDVFVPHAALDEQFQIQLSTTAELQK